jgi:hypothetical protein
MKLRREIFWVVERPDIYLSVLWIDPVAVFDLRAAKGTKISLAFIARIINGRRPRNVAKIADMKTANANTGAPVVRWQILQ